jgi:class 3 adenylate cyclase
VLGSLGEDIDVAIGSIDRALALNPGFARGWVWSARLRNYAGQPDLAIEHFKTSLRLSPRDRMGTFSLPLGGAYFLKHQFEDAAAILMAALEQAPGLPVAYQLLASCYAHMGRLNEARDIVKRLRKIACRRAKRHYLPEPRRPRTLPVRSALGGRRGSMSQTRRLAAILAADVAGYSRLIGADEGGTLERLKALRRDLFDPKIAEHRGRLVKTTGDGLLVEFGSVVDALRCAVEVQREMVGRNAGVPPGPTTASSFASVSMSGMLSSRMATSLATASMSQRGSKLWPSPVESASRRGCRRMPRAVSTSPSKTSASSNSRTQCGPSGPTA